VPSVEDFHAWTFYADGIRPCITSGFNAYQPLGSTATPTATAIPSNTPGNTPTPTPTIVPVPTLIDVTPSTGLTCNSIVTLRGKGFGTPPSVFGTTAFLVSSGPQITLQQIGTGSDTSIRVQLPSSGLTPGSAAIQVSSGGGDSGTVSVNVVDCSLALTTPTPSETATPSPTSIPAPSLTRASPSAGLTCNSAVTLTGNNFGSPPSSFGTTATLINNGAHPLQLVGTGSNTSLNVVLPASGLTAGQGSIRVSNNGGDSPAIGVTIATTC
jgi:hypothetical protein